MGTKNDGNLRRAESKISRFSDTPQWCGYLTPSEALALLDDGGREGPSSMDKRKYFQEKRDSGDSAPQWFYFFPSKTQCKRWGKETVRRR